MYENIAGYPTFKGQVLNGEQLWELIEGLEANDLLFYTHLLTGSNLLRFLFSQQQTFFLYLALSSLFIFLMKCRLYWICIFSEYNFASYQ